MRILIGQILGISAVILFLLSFQFKKRKNILIVNIFSDYNVKSCSNGICLIHCLNYCIFLNSLYFINNLNILAEF